MFDGWFSYGGQEIINAPRTKAYLEHLQPTLSLGSDCCPCDTLAAALGDQPYSTPSQDDAEWFNPYATETAGFYGLLPLALEGFEDSTWSTPITDLIGDGSVAGRGRRGGRDLRFKVLAVAESEKAMSRGLSWLRDALGAEGCATGECGGAQVCYLTDCPSCCSPDAPEVATVVDHLDYRPMTQADAAARAAVDWTATVDPIALSVQGQTYAYWADAGVTLERTLTGFVPGAAYRIALDWGSWSGPGITEIKVTVPGAAELLAPRTASISFNEIAQPPQGVAVWEFIATECEHRITIESTVDIAIGLWDVSLSSLDAVVYSAQPVYYVDDATAWSSPLLTNPAYHVTSPAPGQWRFGATASTPMPEGTASVEAVITGLHPSSRYAVTIFATSDHNFAYSPASVTVTDSTGDVLALVALPSNFLSTGAVHGGWVTVEFQATQAGALLSVENATGFNVIDAAPLEVSIRSVTVEEVNVDPTVPDPNATLNRYLRDVVLTSGPVVTGVYPSYTAVMKQIEWTMRANVPDPLGEDILVTETLGSGRWIVPEVACSLGEEVRYNWLPTPSGEYGTAGWPVPAGSNVTNPTSATAKSGTHVIRVTQTTANSTNRVMTLVTNKPIMAGTSWTFTLPVRSLYIARRIYGLVTFKNGTLTTGTANAYLDTTDSQTDWQTIVAGGTAPPGTTSMTVAIQMNAPSGGFVLNEYAEFDALMLEETYGQRAYFDGDSLYGSWAGAPGNSVSMYERTSTTLVFDPDCPPSPPAPRPPDIVNDCLTTPDTWIRYVLDIPALATAEAPRSAPTVTLTTGANDARGVRVRVYANPFSRSFKDLDPCSFCGEFLISYLPANSSLTVDAADKTALVSTPQGSQSALGLLYGSDGGPVTWPVLGCAMPYLMTLDLDAAVAPLIAASLSVTPVY